MKKILIKYPIVFVLAFIALVLAFIYVRGESYTLLESYGISHFQSVHLARTIMNAGIIILTLFTIRKLALQKLAGIGGLSLKNKLFLIAPLALVLISATNAFEIDYTKVAVLDLFVLLLSTLSVGVFEEITFRGLLQSYLVGRYWSKKGGILLSVVFAAAIFGTMHLVVPNENPVEKLVQLGYATYFGVFFGAILLRTNKFLPLGLTHGLFQFFSQLDELKPDTGEPAPEISTMNSLMTLVALLPMLLFGIILVLKINKKELKKKIP